VRTGSSTRGRQSCVRSWSETIYELTADRLGHHDNDLDWSSLVAKVDRCPTRLRPHNAGEDFPHLGASRIDAPSNLAIITGPSSSAPSSVQSPSWTVT
jgi:hypothetical protein